MFKKILISILLNFLFISTSLAQDIPRTTTWNSPEGLKKLEDSQFKNDFYQLVNFYQPQENPLFCGIASATIILNALDHGKIVSQKEGEVKRPDSNRIIPYPLYTQQSFFNSQTEKVKKRAIIEYREQNERHGQKFYDPGVSLDDYAALLKKGHGLTIFVHHANTLNQKSIDKFREILKQVLIDDKKFILANFDGKLLGQKTRGHISPLVAYETTSDSVLILDVALHKNKWYWVSVENLYQAMHSQDGDVYRGYLVAKR